MLSRIADSMYWMARSLERADNTARSVDISLLHLLEAEDALPEESQWHPILAIFGGEHAYSQVYADKEIKRERVIRFMTQERTNPGSVLSSLRDARENARVVRDQISREMWESMNEFWLQVDRYLQRPLRPERAAEFFSYVQREVARFHGHTVASMMRGEPFGFYLLGTFLERADMTARILDVKYHLLLPDPSMVGSALDYYQWGALLKSISGFEAYRRRYHTGLRPIDVAEFVILEDNFPRSLRFCLDRISQAVEQIGTHGEDSALGKAHAALREQLERKAARDIFEQGLHEYLDEFLAHVSAFNEALQSDYFEAHLAEAECVT